MFQDIRSIRPLLDLLPAVPKPGTTQMDTVSVEQRKASIAINARDFFGIHLSEVEIEALQHVEVGHEQGITLFTDVEDRGLSEFEMKWHVDPDTTFRFLHKRRTGDKHARMELEVTRNYEGGQIVLGIVREPQQNKIVSHLALTPRSGRENGSRLVFSFDQIGVTSYRLYGADTEKSLQDIKDTFGDFDQARLNTDLLYATEVYRGFRNKLFAIQI